MRGINYVLRGLPVLCILAAGCANEESDWNDLREEPTLASLERFIAKYPDGEFFGQAQDLEEEVRDWEAAVGESTEEAYRRFLAEHPGGLLQHRAREAHDALVTTAMQSFRPEHLMIVDDFGLVDLVRDADDGTIKVVQKVQWRGPLRYSLGQGGAFTGIPTYIPPDPASENVAIAVISDANLIGSLRAGRAYVWRGGDLVYEWQDISTWGSRDEIAARLGMPGDTEYSTAPPALLSD